VAGEEFSAAAVAAGVGEEIGEVEERCEGLVRREQVLEARGTAEWPDGTVAARYGFAHALYQEVLYGRVPAGRRVRLHRQIGPQLEAAYGARAEEVAAELAVHFEQGREYERAVRYREQAARRARRRSASQEAIQHLRTALRLLEVLPDTPARTEQELALQTSLGLALTVTRGHAAQEVEQAYARARELCKQVGESPQLFPVLFGLWTFHLMRAEYRAASELCGQMLGLAERVQYAGLLLEAHGTRGVTSLYLGEFAVARAHLEQSVALYHPQQHRAHALLYGQDPRPAPARASRACRLAGCRAALTRAWAGFHRAIVDGFRGRASRGFGRPHNVIGHFVIL
jgi:tetratricopeptide (TPR) repeat protein